LEFANRKKMMQEHRGEVMNNEECQDHLLGLTKTVKVMSTYTNKMTKSLIPPTYTITSTIEKVLILQGLPLLLTSVVLVHELGHCLACKEGYKLPKKEEEGLCELLAYIWLSKLHYWSKNKIDIESDNVFSLIGRFSEQEIDFHRRRIQENKNEIYGQGFSSALVAVHEGWTFRSALKYCSEHRRYPNFEFGPENSVEVRRPRTVSSPTRSAFDMMINAFTSLGSLKEKATNFIEASRKAVSSIVYPDPNFKRFNNI